MGLSLLANIATGREGGMNELLSRALQAHGGLDQWNRFDTVHTTIVSGGQLWAMKGTPQDAVPREMKVATKYDVPSAGVISPVSG